MKIQEILKGQVPPAAFAREIFPHDPPGIRAFRLRKWVIDRGDHISPEVVPYMQSCIEEADRISDQMAARNREARAFERSGRIDDAIELYERNVRQRFDGNMPYERLRVIYKGRERYQDAHQVCGAFISMADRLLELGSPREDLDAKRDYFAEWKKKLESGLD